MEIMENVNYCKYVAALGWQEASGSGEREKERVRVRERERDVPFMPSVYSSVTICLPSHASTISLVFFYFYSLAVLRWSMNVTGVREHPPPHPSPCTHIIHISIPQRGPSRDQYRQ